MIEPWTVCVQKGAMGDPTGTQLDPNGRHCGAGGGYCSTPGPTLDIEVIKSLEITGHLPPQPAILLITLHGGDHYTVDSVRSP